MLKLKIHGELLSKSNSRIFTNFNGCPQLIKSSKALEYVNSSLWELKSQLRGHRTFQEPVKMNIIVYYKTKRPDLDISLAQDIFEKAGVYKNDRLVYELHVFKRFDKKNPRLEAEISLI